MAELTGLTNFEAINWTGLFVPTSAGEGVANQLNAAVATVLRKRDIADKFAKEGVEIGGLGRDAFGAFLAVEQIKWAKIIRARGIKPD